MSWEPSSTSTGSAAEEVQPPQILETRRGSVCVWPIREDYFRMPIATRYSRGIAIPNSD